MAGYTEVDLQAIVLKRVASLPPLAYGDGRLVKVLLERHLEGSGYHLAMHTRASIPMTESLEVAGVAAAIPSGKALPDTSGAVPFRAGGQCTRWALVERLP